MSVLENELEWLYSQGRSGERGWARARALLDRLGSPDNSFDSVRVVGTNGKGSTCAMLSAGLRSAGECVGTFTSPHLQRYEERIRVNGEEIERAETLQFLEWARAEQSGAAFFELTFALAAQTFARRGVSVAVMEAGVGGQTDSTHALRRVSAVCLTNVALDHVGALGETVADIASDKAGAARAGVPLLSTATGEAAMVVRRVAAEQEAPLYTPQSHPALFALPHAPLLAGKHQEQNAALALATLRLLGYDQPEVCEAALSAFHAGRLESFFLGGKTILLDGAHNPHASEALAASLSDRAIETLIFGGLSRKDTHATVQPLLSLTRKRFFTAPDETATPPEQLAAQYEGVAIDNPLEALRQALEATSVGGTVLAAGSLYLVGELRAGLVRGVIGGECS